MAILPWFDPAKILILPVLLAAAYCLMVSICVAGRMSRATTPVVRWPILIIGYMAAWAILRTIEGDWSTDLPAIIHGAAVVGFALTLAVSPRIPT